jgi:hypothetical protein
VELNEDDNFDKNFTENYASNAVLQALNITNSNRDFEKKYLLITPEIFLDFYADLLEFRRIQGLDVFVETVETIQISYPGNDLSEKIRNYIIAMYENFSISFVTLGADTDAIPSRTVFAFDCEFGLYGDENDIRADMYYSCLNGNWDANGNEIYGEEDDEVDFFPEVFVGRISANSSAEITDYVSRLISYEKGEYDDYNRAGGFSMELWDGSDSEVCQQYIYQQYFPEYYDITLLYDEENTMQNAYDLLNQNMNIVQHTGDFTKNKIGNFRVERIKNCCQGGKCDKPACYVTV